mgnify:FL=1
MNFLVYDSQTIDSVDFNGKHTNLILKFGAALKDNEILLYVLSDFEPCSFELTIDENKSLTELWNSIKHELRIPTNDYHLCEVASTANDNEKLLDELDQNLKHNGLVNGSQIMIKEGTIPSKNHVRVRVLRIIDRIHEPTQASLLNSFQKPNINSLCLVHINPWYEMNELGLFELPLISPFNVLRDHIVNCIGFRMPANFSKGTQAFEFIRLYNVEDDQPISVVHEPAMLTLK